MTRSKIVAVVTGASRGAGAGLAIGLGQTGATVYVTGRTQGAGQSRFPGSIAETANAVTAAGGMGIAVSVDHGDDAQIKALFERVADEQQGQLDILVNNVAYIDDDLINPGVFWEKPLDLVKILDIGLRSHYVASYHAAPLMVARGSGLVTFSSSFGSACYMHGPAYGAQKVGVDKFAADMAVDFRGTGVSAVSIWMGPLKTHRTAIAAAAHPEQYAEFMKVAESPEFTGRIIRAIHDDPKRDELSGQTLIGAEIAQRYDITDDGGVRPPSYREMLGEPRIPHPAIVR
ncbi:SDR family NAD(P)-dependent oxidoreductase [Sphingomonas jatrophae]|uniref:NAD(P)-dependent dehydrogenase, short-chain alcohol dehydrogenase family n=1 Tax=Sphingomonas jatrophae TaxID=1166337 RepID=A0A1I6KFI4_9SPHN|nr:SDR family NAD(P)-dependent oxidoreductase [Sphingomonas jatrophae]SFR89973.1 NAD(P)-dependent dehydrogenase, short-chain alcohol dehydrogenase family [Sphingomonas jatrophae]